METSASVRLSAVIGIQPIEVPVPLPANAMKDLLSEVSPNSLKCLRRWRRRKRT